MLMLQGCGGGSGDSDPQRAALAAEPNAKTLAAPSGGLAANTQRLTLSTTGGAGKVATVPATVACADSCIADIPAGAGISVRAVPAPGFTFAGWEGDCNGATDCGIQMTTSRRVTARFAPIDPLAECMAPRSNHDTNWQISPTHPKVLLSDTAWKTCLQQRLSRGTPAAQRFKALVDSQVGGSNNYGYEAWWSALMYQLTGEARYATHAIAMTDALVAAEEATIAAFVANPDPNATPGLKVSYDSYLYVGEIIGGLATVYDWTHPLLTPQQRERWIAYANRAVANVWDSENANWGGRRARWTGWSVDNPFNNYYYSFLRATMLLGLATHGENPRAGAWLTKFRVDKVYDQLVPAFNAQLQGGGSREGTGYGTAMMNLWRLYDWWERSTGDRIATLTPHTLASLPHLLHNITPTLDRLAPTGDHARDETAMLFDYHRDYLLGLINLFPEERISAVAKAALDASTVPNMRQNYDFLADFMYAPHRMPQASLSELSSVYWGAGTGQLMMRSDWGTGAGFVNFICGPYSESHAHRDQGSFVFFRGDWLAWDSNMRYPSGILQDEFRHNLVRLVKSDGSTIRQVYGAPRCELKALVERPEYTYAVADVTPVYNRQSGVTQVLRELLFLKPGVVVVADRVTTGTGIRKVWTLNLPAEPTLSSGRMTMVKGSQKLDVFTAAPTAAQGSWVDGDRVEITDTTNGASFFLNVLAANGAVQQALRNDDGTQQGVRIELADGRVALVRFNAGAAGGRIELRQADGSVKVDAALEQTVTVPPVFTDNPVPIPAPDPITPPTTPTPAPTDPAPPVPDIRVDWVEPVTGPAPVAPATVRMTARATASARVVRMELLIDGQRRADASGTTVTYTATQMAAGTYNLQARAILDDGSMVNATPFTLRVEAAAPPPEPVTLAWIEPVLGPSPVAPADLRMTVRATPASRVVRTELWINGQKKAEAAGATASFTATQLPAGAYRLEARSVLDDNSVVNAAAFVLTVENPVDTSIMFRQGVSGYGGATDLGVSNQYVQYNGGRGLVSNDPVVGAYRIAGSGGYEVRSFLRFDGLQSLQGRRVTRAELALTFNFGATGYTLNVQSLTKPWNPSSNSFGWTMTGTGLRWETPGSGAGDWESAPVATVMGFNGGQADTRAVALPAALVQRWIDQPANNHGLVLVPITAGKVSWLRSSEDTNPAWRPTLRVWVE